MAKTKKGMAGWLKAVIAIVVIAAVGVVGYYGATGELFQGKSFKAVEKGKVAEMQTDKVTGKDKKLQQEEVTLSDAAMELVENDTDVAIMLDRDNLITTNDESNTITDIGIELKESESANYIIQPIEKEITDLELLYATDKDTVTSDLSTIKETVKQEATTDSIAVSKVDQLDNLVALSVRYPELNDYVQDKLGDFSLADTDLAQTATTVKFDMISPLQLDQTSGFLNRGEEILAAFSVDKEGVSNYDLFIPYWNYEGDINSDIKVVVFNEKGEYGFANFQLDTNGLLSADRDDIAENVAYIAIVATDSFSGEKAMFQNAFAIAAQTMQGEQMFVEL